MRTITLEEHYASPAFLEGPLREMTRSTIPTLAAYATSLTGFPPLVTQLCDLDERRITEMDDAGIDVQVLSLTVPGVEQLDATEAVAFARAENEFVADAVRRHPSRFAGFAALPTIAPRAAADELERTVLEHGFKGAMINGHTRGRYLDDQFFWPILEGAAALQVPLYLHPAPPPRAVLDASYAGFLPMVQASLATAAWGWHLDTALHVLRLILGGAFDRYPSLQVVIGHLGECLPFMLPRLDIGLPTQVTKLERPIGAYLRENVHYTFSGFNWTPAFLDLMLEVGVNRVMFSADYPFGSMAQARALLEQLPVSPADKERIAHRNAECLLRM